MDSILKIEKVEKIKLPKGTKITSFFDRMKARKQLRDSYNIEKDTEFKEVLLIDEMLEVEDGK